MAYVVQSKDILGWRDEFVTQKEADAVVWRDGLECAHGKNYRIIKRQ